MPEFNIQPKEIIVTTNIVKFQITEIELILYQGANINILMFSENNKFFKSERLLLTQEEYNNWGTDDDYIRDLVCQKLDFVLSI